MKFTIIKYSFILLFFIFNTSIKAQNFFKNSYNVENGLPTRIVFDVCQDNTGLMWFTTFSGISCYDGFQFTNYNSTNGLPSQIFRKLKLDEKGSLWASPYFSTGNFCFKRNNQWNSIKFVSNIKDGFEIFCFDITYIKGKLLICCGSKEGFYVYQNNVWKHFDISSDSNLNQINNIKAKNGKFYISSKNGICIFENGQLNWDLKNSFYEFRQNVLAIEFENVNTSKEIMWVLGSNWLGSFQNSNFEIYSKNFLLPDVPLFNTPNLKIDLKGNIFFGNSTAKFFLTKYDRSVIPLMVGNGLTSNGASSIYIDFENNVWFTDSRGVDKISNLLIQNYYKESGLLENEVSAVAELKNGKIVLGHNNGLTIINKNKFKKIDFSNYKFNSKRVLDIIKDEKDNIWFTASDIGVGKILTNGSIHWYKLEKGNYAISIIKDKSGRIWVGTHKDLYYIVKDKLIKYDLSYKIKTSFRKLFASDYGGILVCGTRGLFYVNENFVKKIPSEDSSKSDNIFTYFKCNDGKEFVGTMNGLYTLNNGRLTKYNSNGINFKFPIYFILLDNQNNYWLGSNEGVYKWDGDKKYEIFNIHNGLAGRETNRSAGIIDSKSGIWIGTDLGLSYFKPESNHQKIIPPKIILLSIEDNKGKKHSLNKNTSFDYNENTLNFQFRGISFVNENFITYKYKLIGFDDNWQEIHQSMLDKVRYVNIPPGNYQFQVCAKNFLGEWSEISHSGIITITIPFYKTWWFYLLLIVIFGSIILSLTIIKVQRTNTISLEVEIAERKRIEQELSDSNQKYHDIVKLLPETIYEADLSGKITYLNDMGLKLFGYTECEIQAEFLLSQLFDSICLDELNNYISLILNKNYTGKIELSGIKKDGTKLPISINAIPITKNNISIGTRGIIINLTDQKIIEDNLKKYTNELNELNISKDKFFSIIAHDFKTPFSGFLGLTKILYEHISDFKLNELKEISKNLLESATNLFKLLENLLEWSRIQRGLIVYNPEICILSLIIRQNINIVSDFSRQKNITLINMIPEESKVFVDISMLNTVLRNLISNAIKFTPQNGLIEIGIVNSKNELELSSQSYFSDESLIIYIKDNGIGMNNEIIEKLFKIDQKVSRLGTEGEPSTGLGLLLCKDFIEKNKGKIWVKSNVEVGSTFYFALPKNNDY